MKILTADRARELLRYERDTGLMYWRVSRGRAKAGDLCGLPDKDGYLRVRVDKRNHMIHRVAWLMEHGTEPECVLDHINGVRDDNRIENLRAVSHAGNAQNKHKAMSHSNCDLLGVCWDKATGKFMASIIANGKKFNLGRFEDKHVAHEAYLTAKRRLHPTCML